MLFCKNVGKYIKDSEAFQISNISTLTNLRRIDR